jgi:hypothetical protein
VAQIGQSLIIMPRSGRGGNGGIRLECTVGLLRRTKASLHWVFQAARSLFSGAKVVQLSRALQMALDLS